MASGRTTTPDTNPTLTGTPDTNLPPIVFENADTGLLELLNFGRLLYDAEKVGTLKTVKPGLVQAQYTSGLEYLGSIDITSPLFPLIAKILFKIRDYFVLNEEATTNFTAYKLTINEKIANKYEAFARVAAQPEEREKLKPHHEAIKKSLYEILKFFPDHDIGLSTLIKESLYGALCVSEMLFDDEKTTREVLTLKITVLKSFPKDVPWRTRLPVENALAECYEKMGEIKNDRETSIKLHIKAIERLAPILEAFLEIKKDLPSFTLTDYVRRFDRQYDLFLECIRQEKNPDLVIHYCTILKAELFPRMPKLTTIFLVDRTGYEPEKFVRRCEEIASIIKDMSFIISNQLVRTIQDEKNVTIDKKIDLFSKSTKPAIPKVINLLSIKPNCDVLFDEQIENFNSLDQEAHHFVKQANYFLSCALHLIETEACFDKLSKLYTYYSRKVFLSYKQKNWEQFSKDFKAVFDIANKLPEGSVKLTNLATTYLQGLDAAVVMKDEKAFKEHRENFKTLFRKIKTSTIPRDVQEQIDRQFKKLTQAFYEDSGTEKKESKQELPKRLATTQVTHPTDKKYFPPLPDSAPLKERGITTIPFALTLCPGNQPLSKMAAKLAIELDLKDFTIAQGKKLGLKDLEFYANLLRLVQQQLLKPDYQAVLKSCDSLQKTLQEKLGPEIHITFLSYYYATALYETTIWEKDIAVSIIKLHEARDIISQITQKLEASEKSDSRNDDNYKFHFIFFPRYYILNALIIDKLIQRRDGPEDIQTEQMSGLLINALSRSNYITNAQTNYPLLDLAYIDMYELLEELTMSENVDEKDDSLSTVLEGHECMLKAESGVSPSEAREHYLHAAEFFSGAMILDKEYAQERRLLPYLTINPDHYFNRGFARLKSAIPYDKKTTSVAFNDFNIAIHLARTQFTLSKEDANPQRHYNLLCKLLRFYWLRSLIAFEVKFCEPGQNYHSYTEIDLVQIKDFLRFFSGNPEDCTHFKVLYPRLIKKIEQADLRSVITAMNEIWTPHYLSKFSKSDFSNLANLIEQFSQKIRSYAGYFSLAIGTPTPEPSMSSHSISASETGSTETSESSTRTRSDKVESSSSSSSRTGSSTRVGSSTKTGSSATGSSAIGSSATSSRAASSLAPTGPTTTISDSTTPTQDPTVKKDKKAKKKKKKGTSKPPSPMKESFKKDARRIALVGVTQPSTHKTPASESKLPIEPKALEAKTKEEEKKAKHERHLQAEREAKERREKRIADEKKRQEEATRKREEERKAKEEKTRNEEEAKRREQAQRDRNAAIARKNAEEEKKLQAEKERIAAEAKAHAEKERIAKEKETKRLENEKRRKEKEEALRLEAARLKAVEEAKVELARRTAAAPQTIEKMVFDIAKQADTFVSPSSSTSSAPKSELKISEPGTDPYEKHLLANKVRELKSALLSEIKDDDSPEAKELKKLFSRFEKELKFKIELPTLSCGSKVKDLLEKLETAGTTKAFVVGGIPRDLELGTNPYRVKRNSMGTKSELDIDLIANLPTNKEKALEKLRLAFPEKEGFEVVATAIEGLYSIQISKGGKKDRFQIMTSKYLSSDPSSSQYQKDPLFYDALSRDCYHNACYADKSGQVYSPLIGTIVSLIYRKISLINKKALYAVNGEEFDEKKHSPEYYALTERLAGRRRLLRALATLATYKNTTSDEKVFASDFALSDEFKNFLKEGVSLLLPDKGPDYELEIRNLNLFFGNKVFSRREAFDVISIFSQQGVLQKLFPGLCPDGNLSEIKKIVERESILEHVYMSFVVLQYRKEFEDLCSKHSSQDSAFFTDLNSLLDIIKKSQPLYNVAFNDYPIKEAKFGLPSLFNILFEKITRADLKLPPTPVSLPISPIGTSEPFSPEWNSPHSIDGAYHATLPYYPHYYVGGMQFPHTPGTVDESGKSFFGSPTHSFQSNRQASPFPETERKIHPSLFSHRARTSGSPTRTGAISSSSSAPHSAPLSPTAPVEPTAPTPTAPGTSIAPITSRAPITLTDVAPTSLTTPTASTASIFVAPTAPSPSALAHMTPMVSTAPSPTTPRTPASTTRSGHRMSGKKGYGHQPHTSKLFSPRPTMPVAKKEDSGKTPTLPGAPK